MNMLSTYKVFLVKTLKEKRYYWARNVFFIIFPLFFILIYLFSDTTSLGPNSHPSGRANLVNEVNDCYFRHVQFAYNAYTTLQDEIITNIPSSLEDKFYYVPNDKWHEELMERFRWKIEAQDERVVGFKSVEDIWNSIDDLGSHSFIIIFSGNHSSLQYTIRSKNNKFQTDQQYSKDLSTISSKITNEYVNYGFLGIQFALDSAFFELTAQSDGSLPYVVQFERIPSISQEPVSSKIHSLGVFFITFSAMICIALIFTRMVEEKSCGFREQLKNATPFSSLNNAALFSINHLQIFTLFFLCLCISYFKGVWINVNFFVPISLIFIYITSIITFTFLVSAFFESSE